MSADADLSVRPRGRGPRGRDRPVDGRHLRGRRVRGVLVASCAAVGLAACGPPPPQVPLARAGTVSNALTGIVTTCGYSYQELAFTAHPDLRALEASAAANARALAGVVVVNPRWIFQGKSLSQIVVLSVRYLDDCSLRQAARVLERATRSS